jgi:hypothetical protein
MPGSFENRHTQGMSSMMIVLMIVGIGTLVAGLVAIAYGILLELSLGNSLIVAGTVAACSGLILLGLCTVVSELKIIARRLADPRGATDVRTRMGLPQVAPSSVPAQPAAADDGYMFAQDQAAMGDGDRLAPSAAPPASPPWQEEAGTRGQPESASASPTPPAKPRRNLLFSSNLRNDRERAAPRVESPVTSDPQSAPPTPPPLAAAGEASSPPAFDDAWPKLERASERPRASEALSQRRSARSATYAPTNGSAAPERNPPTARAEEPSAVTVLKSGVVDGMAYSLYSDGSIEAQMPEGMMRFASIDELRAHLDHRP